MMAGFRYFKLGQEREGKQWPKERQIKPGSVVRVPAGGSWHEEDTVFNGETREWVSAPWLETTDPRSPDSGEGDR